MCFTTRTESSAIARRQKDIIEIIWIQNSVVVVADAAAANFIIFLLLLFLLLYTATTRLDHAIVILLGEIDCQIHTNTLL